MVTAAVPDEPSSWIGCCHTTFLLVTRTSSLPSSMADFIENRGTSSTGPTSKSASQ